MADSRVDDVLELEGTIVVVLGNLPRDAPHFVSTGFIHGETGMPIITALDCTLGASNERGEWICELTMLADDDGRPLIATAEPEVLTECYTDDGEIRTGRFNWLVKEFRIAP